MLLKKNERLPSLKASDGGKLRAKVGKVDEAAQRIRTHITEVNTVLYMAA